MKVFYNVVEADRNSYFEFQNTAQYNLEVDYEREALIEQCALDFWTEHDGYLCEWPLTFSLHQEEAGPELFRSKVELEVEPRFYATSV